MGTTKPFAPIQTPADRSTLTKLRAGKKPDVCQGCGMSADNATVEVREDLGGKFLCNTCVYEAENRMRKKR